jgi:hypothetical protein
LLFVVSFAFIKNPVQIQNADNEKVTINADSSLKVAASITTPISDTNRTATKRVYIFDGTDTAGIDKEAIATIDLPHFEVHEGDYLYSLLDTTLGTASSDTLKALLWDSLKTGVPIHAVFEVYSNNGAGTMDIFETDSNFVGTAVSVLNRNRTSANTTTWTVRKNIGLKGGGTLIYHNEFGSSTSTGSNKLGGAKRDENEIILNPLKRYKIICRVAANTTNVNVEIHFYK